MKIYEVEFKNVKYSGELNIKIDVKALTISDAVFKAQTYIGKHKKVYDSVNHWFPVRSELISTPIN